MKRKRAPPITEPWPVCDGGPEEIKKAIAKAVPRLAQHHVIGIIVDMLEPWLGLSNALIPDLGDVVRSTDRVVEWICRPSNYDVWPFDREQDWCWTAVIGPLRVGQHRFEFSIHRARLERCTCKKICDGPDLAIGVSLDGSVNRGLPGLDMPGLSADVSSGRLAIYGDDDSGDSFGLDPKRKWPSTFQVTVDADRGTFAFEPNPRAIRQPTSIPDFTPGKLPLFVRLYGAIVGFGCRIQTTFHLTRHCVAYGTDDCFRDSCTAAKKARKNK